MQRLRLSETHSHEGQSRSPSCKRHCTFIIQFPLKILLEIKITLWRSGLIYTFINFYQALLLHPLQEILSVQKISTPPWCLSPEKLKTNKFFFSWSRTISLQTEANFYALSSHYQHSRSPVYSCWDFPGACARLYSGLRSILWVVAWAPTKGEHPCGCFTRLALYLVCICTNTNSCWLSWATPPSSHPNCDDCQLYS